MLWSLVCVSALSERLLVQGYAENRDPHSRGLKKEPAHIWCPAVLGILVTALSISSTNIICGSGIILGHGGNGHAARNNINMEPTS